MLIPIFIETIVDDNFDTSPKIEVMIEQGLNANFIIFTKETTVEGGTTGSEHLISFDYAYKLEAMRDWLFAQCK